MRLTIPKFLRRVENRRVKVMRMVRRRTPYAHNDVPFITLWSQKSGCTSVLKWHLYHAGLLDEALAFRSGKTSLNIHVFQNDWVKSQAGHRRKILQQIRQQQKPVINFVRDPWARAYSCYLHSYSPALARLQNRGVENNAMRLRQQVLRDIYGEDKPLETPYSFLQYLQWLQAQALDGLNPHHSPQHSALYDVAPVRHYRLEDFKTTIKMLEQEFDLRDSSQSRELFTSAHHKPKAPLPRDEALASLQGGLPLARDKDYQLPTVTGALLKDTEMGDIIRTVLAKDLAIYDAIQPLTSDLA